MYVRDADYVWLPAVVVSLCGERALVRIDLPTNFRQRTECNNQCWPVQGQERWIDLRDYHNHKLPPRIRDGTDGIIPDLQELPHVHEPAVLYQLKECVQQMKQPFICAGPRQLFVVGPLGPQSQQLLDPSAYQFLYDGTDNGASDETKDDHRDRVPHIFDVAKKARLRLVQDSRDQVILAVGETASGKSTATRELVNYLLVPSGNELLTDLHQQQSHHAASIFRAFGNAKTEKNPSSTRYAQLHQLEYEPDGTIAGSSYQTYMLETSRVVDRRQANFHIFYQLLNAEPHVKAKVLGADWEQALPVDFGYLSVCDDNPGDWEETAEALSFFGWDGLALERLMQAVSVTILLGNVEFSDSNGFAMVENLADLNMVALSLGVPIESIEMALTSKSIKGPDGSPLSVPCNIEEAQRTCDCLSRVLYECIFASVVRQINVLTSAPPAVTGKRNTVSFVDMFGFENISENNQLDTLCVNYANEKVHQSFLLSVYSNFEATEEEYHELPEWAPPSNTATLRLVDGTSGVIKVLRDECCRANATNEVSRRSSGCITTYTRVFRRTLFAS